MSAVVAMVVVVMVVVSLSNYLQLTARLGHDHAMDQVRRPEQGLESGGGGHTPLPQQARRGQGRHPRHARPGSVW